MYLEAQVIEPSVVAMASKNEFGVMDHDVTLLEADQAAA
jgi:hypothetical protein